jgi:hypothetical protein
VEDLRVRRPPNYSGGPSYGGGGVRLVPQLDAEFAVELGHSASSIEDELLLIVGVLGGGIRRGLLRVIREQREGLRSGLVAKEPGARHLDDSSPSVGMVGHCCVLAERHRQRLI